MDLECLKNFWWSEAKNGESGAGESGAGESLPNRPIVNDTKVSGEALRWNFDEGVNDAEVGGEAPCQNIGEGIVITLKLVVKHLAKILMKASMTLN